MKAAIKATLSTIIFVCVIPTSIYLIEKFGFEKCFLATLAILFIGFIWTAFYLEFKKD